MKLRILTNLSLGLWAGLPLAQAQTADDFFHGGAMWYLSNNLPAARMEVARGRERFPDDVKLQKLEELLHQQSPSQGPQPEQNQEQSREPSPDAPQQPQQPNSSEPQDQPSPERAAGAESRSGAESETQRDARQTATRMLPQEAEQRLDAHLGEERVLWFKPEKPVDRSRPIKDW